MAWSTQYKKNIDCNNPKGFSQKAHCAGRKARQRGEKTKSKSTNESGMKKINEGILDKFISGFFDSYRKGIEKQFIKKSSDRNPELAKKLNKISNDLDDLTDWLEKLQDKK